MARPSRGVILPVVLFMLVLLGLLGAMFSFRINADLAATQAVSYRLQTRLAAEAGVERVKLMLRLARDDVNLWYDNPKELHRIVVWANDTDATVWGSNEEFDDGVMAYRFSIVADDPLDDENFVRFGITDESAKLHLNNATESQLRILVDLAVADDEELDAQGIVDAILDWRDGDAQPRGEGGDTESEYYRSLDKPYRVKNGPFVSVEELLLVKGVTPGVLYGEDYDRNGLLTQNEDDGDVSFPPDNEDGRLNRGLYPYLTVYSYEQNVSNDNRPRVYLFGDEQILREQLAEVFEGEPGVVDYIVQATRGAQGAGSGAAGNAENAGAAGGAGGGSTDSRRQGRDDKSGSRQQVKNDDAENSENEAGNTDTDEAEPDGGEAGGEGDEEATGESDPEDSNQSGDEETDDAASSSRPIVSPVSLLRDRSVGGELVRSQLGLEHLAKLMDRTTVVPPDQSDITGLININTAPPEVLRCIEQLTGEQIGRIMVTRRTLSSEELATADWLLMEEVVDLDTLEAIAPMITTRGRQFTVEALGYADHIGMVSRLQVIIDMAGPIPQTIYSRDLSELGGRYPIREEDMETFRVR